MRSSFRLLAAVALAAGSLAAAFAPSRAVAQTVRTDLFVTNGQVNAQLIQDGTLYVGGSFSRVGALTGAGLPMDSTTGLPDPGFPRVTGTVLTALADGSGGWYIGGQFTDVNGNARTNLAHVLIDHSVDSWNPGANGAVRTMTLSGGQLYVGGDFTTLGAAARNRIGSVDAVTGAVSAWNPNANSIVRDLEVNGAYMIVAGQFTTIGGATRNRIAQIDLATGLAHPTWNPNANSPVFTVQVRGTLLYVGGQFTSIGGQGRSRLAALQLATGVPTAWNPNLNSNVNALVASDGIVYAGGQFNLVGATSRLRIAAIDSVTAAPTAWNPAASGVVQALKLVGNSLYAGGDFLSIGGQPRSRIAELDLSTGLATAWNPSAFSTVNVVEFSSPEVFIGGAFTAVGGVERNNLAAFDQATGAPTSWNPNANNQVQALAVNGGTLYAGGNFSQVGGQIRNNIAAIELATGSPTSWNPNADGQVSALAHSGSVVYAGGTFMNIGGQARINLAALDTTTALASAWAPDPDDQVLVIEPAGGVVYLGGNFNSAGGQSRSFIAAVDASTGVATAWDPSADGTVRAIAVTCDRVYAGGFFGNIGGQPRNRLASLSPVTGFAQSWNPDSNGPVFALTLAPGAVYVGGVITTVGGQPRSRAAAVNPVTGAVTAWNPSPNGTVRTIAAGGNDVFLGGAFSGIGALPSGNLVGVSPDVTISCPVLALTPALCPPTLVGTPYAFASSASGGTAPYCWKLSAGSLPAGVTLDGSSGQISGTPTAAGVHVFTLTATDANGCSGSITRTLVVTTAPAVTAVAPQANALCLNPAQTCVTVPFALTRGEATPLRDVSVTFHIDGARLALCNAGAVTNSIHAGDWAAAFPLMSFSAVANGGGSFTVRQVITSGACGPTTGGTLFTLDLRSLGFDGTAAVTVDEVVALACDLDPLAVNLGAPATISGSTTPIVVLPASLPGAVAGVAYSQTLTANPGTTLSVTAGALPPGLTLSGAGALSGTPSAFGTFAFTVTAADPGGCAGSRAYSITVACQNIAVVPSVLPDGAVAAPYSYTVSATAGMAPLSYSIVSGALPDGLTLSGAGLLSGTPTTAGQSLFAIGVTDAAGCTASLSHVMDIFAVAPVSTVAAVPGPTAISTAHSCVSVPVVYTRGEAAPVRGMKVTVQLDPAMLSLCTPLHPDSSITLGSWADAYSNVIQQVTDLGAGAYTVDIVLLGAPCGITTGGTLFDLHVTSTGPDGLGAIGVIAVKSRDCDNTPVPVMAGAQGQVSVHNALLALEPPALPNALVGVAYSQAITTSDGVAPYAFSLLSGALPAGLTLGGDGLLSGTPAASGTFSFTVGVVDAAGCPGSRAYSLAVACSPIAITPPKLADAQVDVPYSAFLDASAPLLPVTWSVTAGSLPAGITLSPTTGEIAGTALAPGYAIFTVTATDPAGCTGTQDYALSVFTDPAASHVGARVATLCLSSVRPSVSVPFVYSRGENAPARSVSVTFTLDAARIALVTPGAPASSIHSGSWLAGYLNRTFAVLDNGGGSYTVNLGLTGAPCGPDSGGTLFTVDVQSIAGDGAAAITVTSVSATDCSGAPLPVVPGAAAQLSVSHSAPPAIADLSAAQVTAGNGGSGTTGIVVTWTQTQAGIVALYRAPFGAYPEYDDGGGTAPDSLLAPASPWTLVSANASPGLTDHPPTRGFWHYVAFYVDSCGNASAVSNRSNGALDYHLGDVSNRVTPGTGDNRVALDDVSLLGAHYGISGATLVTDGVAYLDVGPTTDGLTTSRPTTDNVIDFEDLLLFALDFHAVSAPQGAARPVRAAGPGEVFTVESPSLVEPGQEFTATLRMQAGGRLQGFSAPLAWDPSVVQVLGFESAGWIEGQGGVVLSPRPGTIDAALLGRRETGVDGSGEVAHVRFRALREGDPGVRCGEVIARSTGNAAVDPATLARETRVLAPERTVLLAPAPNPVRGAALISFALAREGAVDLALYGVDGRRMATLAHGTLAAGMHHVDWRGDAAGRAMAPGIYWLRLEAAGERFTRRLVFLR